MPESVVEKAVCKGCGAEVRERTLFCYNCGKAVATEVDGEYVLIGDLKTAADDRQLPAGPIEGNRRNGIIAKRGVGKPTQGPGFAPAATLRKRSRSFQRKPIEVVWTGPEKPLNPFFIVSSIVLFALAALIIVLALMIK